MGHDLIYLLENLRSKIINLKIVKIEICTRLWLENCRNWDSTETAIFKVAEIARDLTKIVKIKIFPRLSLISGQDWSVLVRSGQDWSSMIRNGQHWSGRTEVVRTGWDRPDQFRPGQNRLGQEKKLKTFEISLSFWTLFGFALICVILFNLFDFVKLRLGALIPRSVGRSVCLSVLQK